MLKKLSLLLVAFTLGSVTLASPALATGFTDGLSDAGTTAGINTSQDLTSIIGGIIGAVLAFLGVIFLCLTIYAGVIWMTAQGDPKAITKAREILTAAVIGLVISLASYAIADTVTRQLQKATTGSVGYTGIVHSG